MGKAEGFIIGTNGNGYVSLLKSDHHSVWPYHIGGNDVIVGTYLPLGNYTDANLPAYAFTSDSEGNNFTNLHPSGAFYSIATHVTNSGKIVGNFGNRYDNSIACLFQGDSVVHLVNPAVQLYSTVSCVNDKMAIIYATLGNQSFAYYKYLFETKELVQLNISNQIANFSRLIDINDEGIAVGYYVDLQVNDRSIGLKYDTRTDQVSTYNTTIKIGKVEYLDYGFFGITNAGKLIGRSGRDIDVGFLQNRAMKMNNDFTGFLDVTPNNGDIYSELNAVNDNGLAVGVLGLPRKKSVVVNKLFVIDVH